MEKSFYKSTSSFTLRLTVRRCATVLLLSLATSAVFAQSTPAGLWQSFDESREKPRALIRVSEKNDMFSGVIEKNLLPNPSGAVLLCTLCTDDRKDKPLIGLEIIRSIKLAAESQVWRGGEILDPDNGKLYKLSLQLQDNGNKLQVRGHIGPFFRTQIWTRVQ